MLFRDLKTGLAIGLTALLFSSGANAGTIGGTPADDMNEDTTNDLARVSAIRATTIATEIFGGSARANSLVRLTAKGDVWLQLGRATRFPISVDLEISGAAFRDVQLTAAAKQMGVFALVGTDGTDDTEVMIPLFAGADIQDTASPPNTLREEGDALMYSDFFARDGSAAANQGQFLGATLHNADGEVVTIGAGADNIVLGAMDSDHLAAGLVPFYMSGTEDRRTDANCTATFPRNDTTVRFRGCNNAGGGAVRAFHIEGISLSRAQGLATPGNSVMISATVTDAEDVEDVIDSADPVALYRSANTVSTSVTSTGRIGIDPFAEPAFSQISNRGSSPSNDAHIGTVTATVSATNNGAGTPVSAAMLAENADVTVSHGVFSDDAFVRVQLGRLRAPSRTYAIEGDSVVYDEIDIEDFAGERPAAGTPGPRPGVVSEVAHEVTVVFNGEDPISTWDAGDASVSYTDDDAEDDLSAPAGASGALASFSRGGLRTELNMAQSSAGDGGTRYQSWVRIHNNGVSEGSVTIHVMDAETGDMLGSWDSGDIPAGGAIQVSAENLEDHLGHTPVSGDQYNLVVEGGINGYVQHVMWNSVDGLFSDLSGFRAGGGLNTAP